MKSTKERKVDVREDDMSVTQIVVNNNFIEFYKKETGRSHVTQKGLANFINHLLDLAKHKEGY